MSRKKENRKSRRSHFELKLQVIHIPPALHGPRTSQQERNSLPWPQISDRGDSLTSQNRDTPPLTSPIERVQGPMSLALTPGAANLRTLPGSRQVLSERFGYRFRRLASPKSCFRYVTGGTRAGPMSSL